MRIYKWYRVLLELERDAFKPDVTPEQREELLRQLGHIETAVDRITIPAPFGDLFYGLRSHINIVRNTLKSDSAPTGVFTLNPVAPNTTETCHANLSVWATTKSNIGQLIYIDCLSQKNCCDAENHLSPPPMAEGQRQMGSLFEEIVCPIVQ